MVKRKPFKDEYKMKVDSNYQEFNGEEDDFNFWIDGVDSMAFQVGG